MENRERFVGTVVAVAIGIVIFIGLYMYREHRLQQNFQVEMQKFQDKKQREDAKPGVVVEPDGTTRWKD